jgi:hypothetical protein
MININIYQMVCILLIQLYKYLNFKIRSFSMRVKLIIPTILTTIPRHADHLYS